MTIDEITFGCCQHRARAERAISDGPAIRVRSKKRRDQRPDPKAIPAAALTRTSFHRIRFGRTTRAKEDAPADAPATR